MNKMIAVVVVAAFLAAGCTGSFNLTKKVYNFHHSQTDKWSDELLFLVVALTPVYGLATFADAIIFNSIEFWTGNNPVTMSSIESQKGNEKMTLQYNPKTDEVLASTGNRGIIFERTDVAVNAKNEKGEVLYSSVQNGNGDVTIYDGNGKLVKEYSSDKIALLKEQYLQN